jgi:hypothetical protein
LSWSPSPVLALVVGAIALVVWLVLSPPGRSGLVRGLLKLTAAALLLLTLLDVGCQRAGDDTRGTLTVLVDRSRSMDVAGADGVRRADAAREWLTGSRFASWATDWDVSFDSFGGSTTDIGAAIEAAASELPDAIIVLSDGRAARGRSAEPTVVPVYGWSPQPVAIPDVALVTLRVEKDRDGDATALAEVAAVGGRAIDVQGTLEVTVDDQSVGRRAVPPLDAGERFIARVSLPARFPGVARVEAAVSVPQDPVSENDRRAALWRSTDSSDRALVVGLAAGWDLAPFARAVPDIHSDGADVFWIDQRGSLYRVDDGADGIDWSSLSMARYGVAYLLGDPAALGSAGQRWVDRFAAGGGRGLLWAPGEHGGRLAGADVVVSADARTGGVPELTADGAGWLTAHGASAVSGPDGSPAWPRLESLAARPPEPPAGATVLLELAGRPAGWVLERGTTRLAVLLGVGYYRWSLTTGGSNDERGVEFWTQWTQTLGRWLAAATPMRRLGLRMPVGSRLAVGEHLVARLAADVVGEVTWRVEPATETGSETPLPVASGVLATEPASREIAVGPFEPGTYRLVVEAADGWRVNEPFVVDPWVPDLAWTAADTASLAAAARASGGAMLTEDSLPELSRADRGLEHAIDATRTARLGTTSWPLIVAAILLLADWAIALASRASAR